LQTVPANYFQVHIVKFRYLLIIIFFFTPPLFAQEGLDFFSLQDALMQENPRLKAMESEAEMVRHKIVQSSSLDDPRLKLGVNNLPADSFSFDKKDDLLWPIIPLR
jgi:hypothetical protein